jgi:hypothetical protein
VCSRITCRKYFATTPQWETAGLRSHKCNI